MKKQHFFIFMTAAYILASCCTAEETTRYMLSEKEKTLIPYIQGRSIEFVHSGGTGFKMDITNVYTDTRRSYTEHRCEDYVMYEYKTAELASLSPELYFSITIVPRDYSNVMGVEVNSSYFPLNFDTSPRFDTLRIAGDLYFDVYYLEKESGEEEAIKPVTVFIIKMSASYRSTLAIMTVLQSKNNTLFLLLAVLALQACGPYDCIDIEKSDFYTAKTKEWVVSAGAGNRELIDDFGIRQTLLTSNRDWVSYEESSWDDCGNSYGSFFHSIQYNTSLSSLHFMIDIRAGDYPYDQCGENENCGFFIRFHITNIRGLDIKNTTYDIVTQKCRDNRATAAYHEQFIIGDSVYEGVLEITFKETFAANDVKTLYFAKSHGLIKFVNGDGVNFWVN